VDVPDSMMGLAWLRQNVQTLKRQYFGIQIANSRQILVHAFPGRFGNWRSDAVLFTDGGCGNVWFEFEVDRRRVARIKCAGTA